jgi:hypothetical protein
MASKKHRHSIKYLSYSLYNGKDYFEEFGENGTIKTCKTPLNAWSEHNNERLEFMLAEYDKRLKGFYIVKVNETKTTTFTVEKLK